MQNQENKEKKENNFKDIGFLELFTLQSGVEGGGNKREGWKKV